MNDPEGTAVIYFPESHEISNISTTALQKNDGFQDTPYFVGQVGTINYGRAGN